jgi:hypothetical protein
VGIMLTFIDTIGEGTFTMFLLVIAILLIILSNHEH